MGFLLGWLNHTPFLAIISTATKENKEKEAFFDKAKEIIAEIKKYKEITHDEYFCILSFFNCAYRFGYTKLWDCGVNSESVGIFFTLNTQKESLKSCNTMGAIVL